MQEIQQSIIAVTNSQGFYFWVGIVISVGMLAGSRFDNKLAGFARSMAIIAPYGLILFLTNATRLYETSLKKTLSADAYNSSVTLFIITGAYIVGLFLGHMAVKKGKEQAIKERQ